MTSDAPGTARPSASSPVDGASATGEVHEIVVAGELDVARSELSAALTAALNAGASRIVVNLLEVSFIDSSVLRNLLLAHREVQSRDGWIRLVYTNHLIGRVISVTGLDEVLPQYASVQAARSGRPVGDDQSGQGQSKGQGTGESGGR